MNSIPAGTEPLDYARVAARLGLDLHMLGEFSCELDMDQSFQLIDHVAGRLREHRFTIAVVGEFKTGKSTFVNALLGVDVLPTDVIPATATLNRITFGMTGAVEVVYKNGRRLAVEFDKLKEYVAKEFVTTEMLAALDEVVVSYPAPYLMHHVDIIDTPGLNDDASMAAVTLSVLPKTDAAIVVISGLSPFSDFTRQFLEERLLTADLGRVIFLINRLGQLRSVEEADRTLAHIEQRITQNVIDRARRELGEDSAEFAVYMKKIGKPQVYGIDAYDALRGLIENDRESFDRSRFAAFQNALRRFLNEDRGSIVLQVPVNRILTSGEEILIVAEARRTAAKRLVEEATANLNAALEEQLTLEEAERHAAEAFKANQEKVANQVSAVWHGFNARLKSAIRDAISKPGLPDDQVGGAWQGALADLYFAAKNRVVELTDEAIAQMAPELYDPAGEPETIAKPIDTVLDSMLLDLKNNPPAFSSSALKFGFKFLFGGRKALIDFFMELIASRIDKFNLEVELAKESRDYSVERLNHVWSLVAVRVKAKMEEAHRRIDESARHKQRQEILCEQQIRKLDQIAERTRSIMENAVRINAMLAARTAVASASPNSVAETAC
jgi:hypothetical protein